MTEQLNHWRSDRSGVPHRRAVLAGSASIGLAAAFHARAQSAGTIVETTHGKLSGRSIDGVQVFKGVRYAASTGGPNRFRPPQPFEPWRGVQDAIEYGDSAPQPVHPGNPMMAWYDTLRPVSEDCLFLNVFTATASYAARRPVMVWLHGGGWTQSAGTAPGFEGLDLVKQGGVVLVTINHRLNLFGHLKLDDSDERFADSGNAGVLDMVAALKWVHDNIAGFGGDPGNVTIFGQSGGGSKVAALISAPTAKGLVHKGIAESCSGALRLAEQAEAAEMAHGLARQLGLARASGEALQAIPMDKVIAAYIAGGRSYYRPMVDGRTFTRHPFDPDASPSSAGIPFMTGNAATEARFTMAPNRGNFSLDAGEVHRRVARFLQIDAAETNRIMDAYRAGAATASPSDLMASVATDYMYIRNTRRQALLQSAGGRAPVYVYDFDWRTPVMDGLLQSPHALEVSFAFGTAGKAAAFVGTGPDIAPLTKMMIATWSIFAHTGNPNNPTLPHWPRFEAGNRAVMMLDTASNVQNDPGGQARASLDRLPFYEYSMPINYGQA